VAGQEIGDCFEDCCTRVPQVRYRLIACLSLPLFLHLFLHPTETFQVTI